MNHQNNVVDFIDETLRDMTTRPSFWGPLPSVELQVLRLLEIRLLLVAPHAAADDVPDVACTYWQDLDADFPGGNGSLRVRVDGDLDRFSSWLAGFCARQQRAQDEQREHLRGTPLRTNRAASLQPPRPWPIGHDYSSDRPVLQGAPTLPRQ